MARAYVLDAGGPSVLLVRFRRPNPEPITKTNHIRGAHHRMKDPKESGFTVVELMAAMAIGALLLTLSAGALRDYTRGKALAGARDRVVTQLRHAQQRTFAEGYPKAYGVRFLKGGQRWDLVRYDASTGGCAVVESNVFDNTVEIAATGTDFPDGGAAAACAGLAPAGSYEVVLFYARGTASAGTVKLDLDESPKTRSVQVDAATGRVS